MLKVSGTITQVNQVEKGTSKAGKEWQKMTFILDSKEQYNNIYCFEIFGQEKIENFKKYCMVGHDVEIDFNVSCRAWNDKYFTTLQMWKFNKVDQAKTPEIESAGADDLPF
jgi:hypothetical protein